jgi:hypothetical protein
MTGHLEPGLGARTTMGLPGWSPTPAGPVGPRGQRPGPWWARPCFRRLGDDVALVGRSAGSDHCICDGAGFEAFDDQIDAQRKLPNSHRECGEPGQRVGLLDEA